MIILGASFSYRIAIAPVDDAPRVLSNEFKVYLDGEEVSGGFTNNANENIVWVWDLYTSLAENEVDVEYVPSGAGGDGDGGMGDGDMDGGFMELRNTAKLVGGDSQPLPVYEFKIKDSNNNLQTSIADFGGKGSDKIVGSKSSAVEDPNGRFLRFEPTENWKGDVNITVNVKDAARASGSGDAAAGFSHEGYTVFVLVTTTQEPFSMDQSRAALALSVANNYRFKAAGTLINFTFNVTKAAHGGVASIVDVLDRASDFITQLKAQDNITVTEVFANEFEITKDSDNSLLMILQITLEGKLNIIYKHGSKPDDVSGSNSVAQIIDSSSEPVFQLNTTTETDYHYLIDTVQGNTLSIDRTINFTINSVSTVEELDDKAVDVDENAFVDIDIRVDDDETTDEVGGFDEFYTYIVTELPAHGDLKLRNLSDGSESAVEVDGEFRLDDGTTSPGTKTHTLRYYPRKLARDGSYYDVNDVAGVSFKYKVQDSHGNTSNVATHSITILNINDAPTLGTAPTTTATNEDVAPGSVSFSIAGGHFDDIDFGDKHHLLIKDQTEISEATQGNGVRIGANVGMVKVSSSGGTGENLKLVFTPDPNYFTPLKADGTRDTTKVYYKIKDDGEDQSRDSNGNIVTTSNAKKSSEGVIHFTINPVNDAPTLKTTAGDQGDNADEDSLITITLDGTQFEDVDDDAG